VSENRTRPLVSAVPGDRPESPYREWTLGAHGLDAGSSWWTPVWTGNGHGRRVRLSTPWREHCSARLWTAVDMTARGRRWRTWTWLSGAVSAADTTVRKPGRITAVLPTAGTGGRPAGQRGADSGHELGRRVPPARSAGTLHGWRWSGAPATRPLSTREEPSVAGATGTQRARPARTNLPPVGCRWPQLGRRARLVRGDHLPQWRGRHAHGAGGGRGSNPVQCCSPRPRSKRWMACDLRFLLTGRDRSCPPPTSGFRCRADPERTRAGLLEHAGQHRRE
jgi:hypothetical protein